jgi:hypothetical protein
VEWWVLSLELLNSNMILTLFCLGVLAPTKVQHMSKSILVICYKWNTINIDFSYELFFPKFGMC